MLIHSETGNTQEPSIAVNRGYIITRFESFVKFIVEREALCTFQNDFFYLLRYDLNRTRWSINGCFTGRLSDNWCAFIIGYRQIQFLLTLIDLRNICKVKTDKNLANLTGTRGEFIIAAFQFYPERGGFKRCRLGFTDLFFQLFGQILDLAAEFRICAFQLSIFSGKPRVFFFQVF